MKLYYRIIREHSLSDESKEIELLQPRYTTDGEAMISVQRLNASSTNSTFYLAIDLTERLQRAVYRVIEEDERNGYQIVPFGFMSLAEAELFPTMSKSYITTD